MDAMISAEGLSKTFTLHGQGGLRIPVFDDLSFAVRAGECVALGGASGSGKSTLLRSLYANYRPCGGRIRVRHGDAVVDLVTAPPRDVLAVRRTTIGYVSQFLRAIPRVPAREVVAEPLLATGVGRDEALIRADAMLERLNLPRRLWEVPPATFSGGEQQRVNVARGFVRGFPVLLLDEPTASLDAGNRAVVVELIREATARGAAVVGIFHDHEVRDAVASRIVDVTSFKRAA